MKHLASILAAALTLSACATTTATHPHLAELGLSKVELALIPTLLGTKRGEDDKFVWKHVVTRTVNADGDIELRQRFVQSNKAHKAYKEDGSTIDAEGNKVSPPVCITTDSPEGVTEVVGRVKIWTILTTSCTPAAGSNEASCAPSQHCNFLLQSKIVVKAN